MPQHIAQADFDARPDDWELLQRIETKVEQRALRQGWSAVVKTIVLESRSGTGRYDSVADASSSALADRGQIESAILEFSDTLDSDLAQHSVTASLPMRSPQNLRVGGPDEDEIAGFLLRLRSLAPGRRSLLTRGWRRVRGTVTNPWMITLYSGVSVALITKVVVTYVG